MSEPADIKDGDTVIIGKDVYVAHETVDSDGISMTRIVPKVPSPAALEYAARGLAPVQDITLEDFKAMYAKPEPTEAGT